MKIQEKNENKIKETHELKKEEKVKSKIEIFYFGKFNAAPFNIKAMMKP
jgi:hypothetical protein